MQSKGPLWSELSASARAELIPIVSTAILVGAGEATPDALVRLAHLTPFSKENEATAVTDVTGMLMLVNLAVVIWFAYRALEESFDRKAPVTLDAKLVGLGTAFLTSADLISYGVKSQHPEGTVYALLVLLLVFIVPFFLIERRTTGAKPDDEVDVGRHAMAALALHGGVARAPAGNADRPPNLFVSQASLPGAEEQPLPDIEGHSEDYDLIHFDTEPGDVLVHHYRTLHGAGGNLSRYQVRRAASIRYTGDDVRFETRTAAPKLLHLKEQLQNGDRLNDADHPVVWRRSRNARAA